MFATISPCLIVFYFEVALTVAMRATKRTGHWKDPEKIREKYWSQVRHLMQRLESRYRVEAQ